MPTMVDGIWRACAFASSNWLMFLRSQRLVANVALATALARTVNGCELENHSPAKAKFPS